MSSEDDVKGGENFFAAAAHVGLTCMASYCLTHSSNQSFTFPGMHFNFLAHGILGVFYNQRTILENDLKSAYSFSKHASRCFALPFFMGECYHDDPVLSKVHLVSGAVPFAIAVMGQNSRIPAKVIVGLNVLSLCYFSHKKRREWGWVTAGVSVVAYFLVDHLQIVADQLQEKVCYPLALALLEYCALKAQAVAVEPSEPGKDPAHKKKGEGA